MSIPKRFALAIGSALLMALALPNELFVYGNPALGTIALFPLYLALSSAGSVFAPHHAGRVQRRHGILSLFLVGAAFGACQHAATSFWLWYFKDFAFWTLGSTTIAYGLVYGFFSLYLCYGMSRSGIARPIAFALVWTAFEFAKSTGFLAYPWGLIGYSWSELSPFIQIADVTGVYGPSFALAFLNACLGEAFICLFLPRLGRPGLGRPAAGRPALAYLAAPLALVLAFVCYGYTRMSEGVPIAKRFTAVIVQQNSDSWSSGGEIKGLERSIALARREIDEAGKRPDIVLFSETSLKRPYLDFIPFFERFPDSLPLRSFIKDGGLRLFTGAPIITRWGDEIEGTNSVILIGPDGSQEASYAKIHPVPFAEAIPLWEFPLFRAFMQNVVGLESGWTTGSERTIFQLPTGSGQIAFAAPICFEDAFADLCRDFVLDGAELWINLTNDSWSQTVSAEIQHYTAARFRSIEHRMTMVRSTNGGLSCVIDAFGRTIAALPLFEANATFVEVPVYKASSPTVYTILGDWFAYSILFIIGLSFVAFVIVDRRGSVAIARAKR